MVEPFKFLSENGIEPSPVQMEVIWLVSTSMQIVEIRDFALQNYADFYLESGPIMRSVRLLYALLFMPLKEVESIFGEITEPEISILQLIGPVRRQFSTFDFLYEKLNGQPLPEELQADLIAASMESCLAESKIREYVEKFGTELLTRAHLKPSFLIPAAANGYLTILKDLDLSGIGKRLNVEAIAAAAKNRESQVIYYIIDSLDSLDFVSFSEIALSLVKYKNREELKFLLEKYLESFDNPEDPKLKTRTLLAFVACCSWVLDLPEYLIKKFIADFCQMVGWTRYQFDFISVKEATPHQIYEEIKELFDDWKLSDDRIRVFCLKFWDKYAQIMQECLKLLPKC